jgi:hypothetical protein
MVPLRTPAGLRASIGVSAGAATTANDIAAKRMAIVAGRNMDREINLNFHCASEGSYYKKKV